MDALTAGEFFPCTSVLLHCLGGLLYGHLSGQLLLVIFLCAVDTRRGLPYASTLMVGTL